MKKILALTGIALLVACGDDVTQINQNGLEVVESVGDLPKCSGSNEGEQAYVKGELSPRICIEGEWFATKTSEAPDFSCKTEELKDGSGLKIICNGDSIGVVLNGEKGKDGKNGKDGKDGEDGEDGNDGNDGVNGSGCSMTDRTESTITVVCGDSTMVIELGTGSSGDELEPDSERVAVSLDSLAGFSQKGPFLKGSKVFLYELSDGRTLKQTNGNFTSYITREDGRYKFSARDLASQYAMIEVEGNYRNEVTGKPSDAAIRLRALTDMRKRSNANVNLLTTLEFDRVYYLVTREHKTVKQAKIQAQKEILSAFYIDTTKVTASSEDLDVFGEGEGNAALLAISILLQRDTTETALTVLMTEIANGLETTGKWDDLAARAAVAKWALEVDSGDASRLNDFRYNVHEWGLGEVPEFEKHIRRFASLESGLGICGSDSVPVGMVKNATNPDFGEFYAENYLNAFHKTRFICEDGGVGKWHVATDIQKDTLNWGHDAKKGDFRYGQINSELTYVYDGNYWRHGTDLDGVVGFGCIEDYKDTVLNAAGLWFKCVGDTNIWIDESYFKTAWRNATNIEKDTVGWGHDYNEGSVQRGQITGQAYVYENNNWRLGTEFDGVVGLGCIETRKDTVLKAADSWFKCVGDTSVWIDESYFDMAWRYATDIEMDTVGWGHGYVGDVQRGQSTGQVYVYENNSWRLGTEMDLSLKKACMESTEGDTSAIAIDGVYYVCDPNACGYYSCVEYDYENGACLEEVCVQPLGRQWTAAPDIYNDTYVLRDECKKGDNGAYGKDGLVPGELNPENIYVCDNGKFRAADSIEVGGGKSCTSYNRDTVLMLANQYSYYRCTKNNWEIALDSLNFGTVEDTAGNVYKTVGIKTQIWMAENMRLEVEGSLCLPDADSCAKYGRYYTWVTAIGKTESECGYGHGCFFDAKVRGICPDGWHVPSREEWDVLIDAVGGYDRSSEHLKSKSGWNQNGNGLDTYGFNMLPSNEAGMNGYVYAMSYTNAYVWTSTDYDGMDACDADFTATYHHVTLAKRDKRDYYSVRCVMDRAPADHN